MSTQKLIIGLTAGVAVALLLSALVTGELGSLVPTALVGVVLAVLVTTERSASQRVMRRHRDDPAEAVADEREPIPSPHLITDEETALGDTAEAHKEVGPRDFPPEVPGRRAVEDQAGERGTTRGDDDHLRVPPPRRDRLADVAGKSEEMEGGSPELEDPSHPVYDERVRQHERARRAQERIR